MVTTCSICGTTEAVDPGEFSKCLLRDIMEDGREFFSNNRWHQGDIPERFLKLIDKSHFAKWVR